MCALSDNKDLEFVEHSQSCISNYDYMFLESTTLFLSIKKKSELISSEVTVPVLVINRAELVSNEVLFLS
jgi:hypothetical protein